MNSIYASVISPPRVRETPVEENASNHLSSWTEDPDVLDKMKKRSLIPLQTHHAEVEDSEPPAFPPSFVPPPRVARGREAVEKSEEAAFDAALDSAPLEVDPVQEAQEEKAFIHALDSHFDPLEAISSLFFPPPKPTHFEASDDLHKEIEKLHEEARRREAAQEAAQPKTLLRSNNPTAVPRRRTQDGLEQDAYDELQARKGDASGDDELAKRDEVCRSSSFPHQT